MKLSNAWKMADRLTTALAGAWAVLIGCPNCLPVMLMFPLPAVIVIGMVNPSTV